MKTLWKVIAFVMALLLIAVSCEKDEFAPVTSEEGITENVDFRNRATLPPEVLSAIQMVQEMEDEVHMLMLERKLPTVNGNYINGELAEVELMLKANDVTAALGKLQGLAGYLFDINDSGILADEDYLPLDADLKAIIALFEPTGGDDTFTDPRDGKVYQTVVLADGNTWMAENLNYIGDGDFWTDNSWFYGNNPANGATFGRLYTWDAAMQACPPGWHMPSKAEWDNMIVEYDDTWTPSDHLSSAQAYQALVAPAYGGDGSSGFNVLFGGNYYTPDGMTGWFNYLGVRGVFWSSTEVDADRAWIYNFASDYYDGIVFRNWLYSYKRLGFSCRCVKD